MVPDRVPRSICPRDMRSRPSPRWAVRGDGRQRTARLGCPNKETLSIADGRVNPRQASPGAWEGQVGGLSGLVATYPTHTNDQRTLGPSGVGVRGATGVGWRGGAPSVDSARPLSNCGSRSDACPIRSTRRRRWRTFATTLALTLGSLAMPAAALADGQLDPAFNGTGYHVGTAAEGTVFANTDNRIPMVVQARRRASSSAAPRGGFMTLVRYNANGTHRHDVRRHGTGFATHAVRRHGRRRARQQRRHGDDARRRWADIIVAGFGGSQSMVVARFTADGVYDASAVCFAPHLIDYAARALARAPDGTVVLVGYARDRHPSVAVPGTPPSCTAQRAVVTLPATGNSTDLRHVRGARRSLARLDRRDDRRPQPRRHRAPTPRAAAASTRASPRQRPTATSSPPPSAPTATSRRATRWRSASRPPARLDPDVQPAGARQLVPVAGRVASERQPARDQAAGTARAYVAGESIDAVAAEPPHARGARRTARRDRSPASARRHRAHPRRRRQQHRPGVRLPGRQRDRRRLGQPGRAGPPSASRASRSRRRCRTRTFGLGTARSPRRSARPPSTPTSPAWRSSGNFIAVSGRAIDDSGAASRRWPRATSPPARRRPPPPLPGSRDERRRPDHLELRPHQRHGQRQRHREHLVDRVRHDDRVRRATAPQAIADPRPTTPTCTAIAHRPRRRHRLPRTHRGLEHRRHRPG